MANQTSFKPYISPQEKIPEFTLLPILVGAVLGIIFGASSLYLALKVGMTVSASIPVAVLSITLFKAFSKWTGLRQATILENNITQTTGSAGESIAFGVACTMPALMILGFELELGRVMMVAVLGGLLGIVMMIPLRKSLVDDSHGELPYPEGTACAQVLIVGEKGGTLAKQVFTGFFFGLIYKILNAGTRLWSETIEIPIKFFKGAVFASEVSPELVGVGYIIGYRNSALMVGGGLLSSFVLAPAIVLFGEGANVPLFPSLKLIKDMAPHEIWRSYILYIGAGAVAASGILSLLQNLPLIFRAARSGLTAAAARKNDKGAKILRTQQDIPQKWVAIGWLALIAAIWLIPSIGMSFFGALLIVVFGFLFVTVSSRITGQIGSSSNPISGMTVATLLLTSLIFLSLGWVAPHDRLVALTVAAIVCVAASLGGSTAQDLKTGFLVGGTPKYQQMAILIGALTSALVIGVTLKVLNDASTIYSKQNLPQIQISDVSKFPDRQSIPESAAHDSTAYHVVRVTNDNAVGELQTVPPGKYLVDDAGKFQFLVDPGINGALSKRDDGTTVQKFEAPKARLMALIIDGILTRKLPWSLILLGAAIVLMLELCGIPSLAFAVGVYLPLSSSMPIYIGGVFRWFAERFLGAKEDGDSGPGVLLSSGLIAGGSIAGILLALITVRPGVSEALDLSTKLGGVANSPIVPWLGLAAIGFLLLKKRKKAKRA